MERNALGNPDEALRPAAKIILKAAGWLVDQWPRRAKMHDENNSSGYWQGKEPCWVILGCSELLFPECPAFRRQEAPCWEKTVTQCKKLLPMRWDCRDCKISKIYANPPSI